VTRQRSQRSACIAVLVALSVGATACGTRQTHEQVMVAARGGAATSQAVGTAPDGSVPSTGAAGSGSVPGQTGSAAAQAGAAVAPGNASPGRVVGPSAAPVNAGSTADHTPVLIGQIGDFSGIVGVAGQPMRAALAVWVKDINSRGGLAGHPVKLISLDTQGNSSKAQAAVRSLVEDKHVVAIVGAYAALSITAITKYMNEKKVPVIGGELAGYDWFRNAMFFPQGTTTRLALYGILQATVAENKPKMALFYCTEVAVCSDTKTQMHAYASRAHVDLVYDAQVSLAQPDFTAQCINARSAGAQSIMIVMDGGSLARIARDCGRQSFHPALWTGASVFTDAQKSNPDLDGIRAVAQTFPWMLSATPAERAYQQAMQRYAPSSPPAGTASMGWTSGELFRAAVESQGKRATQGPITTQLVLDGLYALRGATVGGLAPSSLTFQPSAAGHLGARCYWIVGISHGAWVANNGDRQVCAPPDVQ
jgi:branched-chain amino acid transport system substrate-binding protein